MENSNNHIDEKSSSLPTEEWLGDELLHQINGFWFMDMNVSGVTRAINEFKPLKNDVILASFPKTGTTWLKSLLYSIINRSSIDSLVTKNPHELVPYLEFDGYGNNYESKGISDSDLGCTRLFSTHIPYQLLNKNFESSNCRIVYVTRNPKDALISAWHFINKCTPLPLDEAVEKFCRGVVGYGPYYEHVLGYRNASLENSNQVFFITYEELKEDTKTHVKRLAEFLGCPIDGEEEVEKIVKNCSFEVLSRHEVNKSEEVSHLFPISNSSFFRQGNVGDHKNHLNVESICRIDELTREKFHMVGFNYGI